MLASAYPRYPQFRPDLEELVNDIGECARTKALARRVLGVLGTT
ncbi:hypothetical protein [Saccharomonospora xinjiangensis]|nr:hypothetical protein [Saccharomonospora xinjiangensis]